MKTIRLASFDSTKLHCTVWDEVEEPKAVVQICHGMGEYGGRYDRFARFLNSKGYIAFADDHRAHGNTETDEDRGHRDGFLFGDTLKDQIFIYHYLLKKYQLPHIFIGHSYGSILAQAFIQQDINSKGIVFLGSAHFPKLLAGLVRILFKPIHMVAYKKRMKLINKLSDRRFNFKYKGDKGPNQWITRDLERRKEFIDDPMCSIYLSSNFFYSLIRGVYQIGKKKNILQIKKDIPIALLSGDMDPIGGFGKKITKLYRFYQKQNVKNITFKLYSGARHELLNETNYEEVFSDIHNFIEECLNN